jgi:hypothetical protein
VIDEWPPHCRNGHHRFFVKCDFGGRKYVACLDCRVIDEHPRIRVKAWRVANEDGAPPEVTVYRHWPQFSMKYSLWRALNEAKPGDDLRWRHSGFW